MAAGNGRVYVSGYTDGVFPGQVAQGLSDGFVHVLDDHGDEVWTRQFGTEDHDRAMGVAEFGGRVYVAGSTDGAFPGHVQVGRRDAFGRTFDADGKTLWTDQFGSPSFHEAVGVDANATGVYIAGEVDAFVAPRGQTSPEDLGAFVRKYRSGGQPVWALEFGIDIADRVYGMAADDDVVYVAGTSSSTAAGQDEQAFVVRVSASEQPPEPPTECMTIEGDVVVRSATDIRQLNAIDGFFDISGGLFVQGTTDIFDLDFLRGLRDVGRYVGISDNRDLETLEGLETLERVGRGLVIKGTRRSSRSPRWRT